MKTKESQLGQVSLRFIRSIAVNRAQTKHSARNRMLANSHAGMATRLPPTWKLARPLNTRAFVGTNPIGRVDNFRLACSQRSPPCCPGPHLSEFLSVFLLS